MKKPTAETNQAALSSDSKGEAVNAEQTASSAVLGELCPWCHGKGRIAPAFDCGPCMGTGKTFTWKTVQAVVTFHSTHQVC